MIAQHVNFTERAHPMAEVGQQAPELKLLNTDRKPVALSDLKGKKTILLFFPGAFTGVCTKELCTFRDALARYNRLDAQVVAISVDSPWAQKGFADANTLTFPLLSDFNRQAVRAYGVELKDFAGVSGYNVAKRAVFVLDKNGVVRWKWISDNPGVEPNYEDVSAAVRAA